MLEIFRKKIGFLAVREVYFSSGLVPTNADRDIDIYIQSTCPIGRVRPFWTLWVDLTHNQEELYKGISRQFRSAIRHAENDDKLIIDVNLTPTEEDLEKFQIFYDNFATYKKLAPTNISKLEVFRSKDALYFTSAKQSLQDSPLAMQSFITDGHRVRSYYAATLPRNENDHNLNALIARASKLLIWKSILAMKALDLKTYDFGGIARSIELQGIDNFKRQFGGFENQEHNSMIGISLLGRIVVSLINLSGRLNISVHS